MFGLIWPQRPRSCWNGWDWWALKQTLDRFRQSKSQSRSHEHHTVLFLRVQRFPTGSWETTVWMNQSINQSEWAAGATAWSDWLKIEYETWGVNRVSHMELRCSNVFVCFNKLTLVFSKDALNWSKMTVKTFIMLQEISISNQCCSFY